MFGVTLRIGVVDDVLEPIFSLLLLAVSFGVDGGAFARESRSCTWCTSRSWLNTLFRTRDKP